MLFYQVAAWVFLISSTLAGAIPREDVPMKPSPVIVQRQVITSTKVPDPQCTNSPNTRACWSNGFSIATDFDAKAPPAGKTVTYNLEITNTTADPDGHGARMAQVRSSS
jgi:hypothetical protein